MTNPRGRRNTGPSLIKAIREIAMQSIYPELLPFSPLCQGPCGIMLQGKASQVLHIVPLEMCYQVRFFLIFSNCVFVLGESRAEAVARFPYIQFCTFGAFDDIHTIGLCWWDVAWQLEDLLRDRVSYNVEFSRAWCSPTVAVWHFCSDQKLLKGRVAPVGRGDPA